MVRTVALLLVIAMAGLLAGCTIEPQPIHIGSDECVQCRMVISDAQFTAQALTNRGVAHKFDSVECLAAFLLRGEQVAPEDLHSTWVADFNAPESWLPAEDAYYLSSETLRSPMGEGLTTYASAEAAREHQAQFGGEIFRWRELLTSLEWKWHDAPHAHHHGGVDDDA